MHEQITNFVLTEQYPYDCRWTIANRAMTFDGNNETLCKFKYEIVTTVQSDKVPDAFEERMSNIHLEF